VGGRPDRARTRHEVSVAPPYRLDLTVSVLRRSSTNLVDVLTPDGAYVRAIGDARAPVFVRVSQTGPETLVAALEGSSSERAPALALVRRTLGMDRDVEPFRQAAARVPWLAPLANRMRGVRPPRYPSLWEACVNAIVFQQVSLLAASAILRRFVAAMGPPLEWEGVRVFAFPTAEGVLGTEDRTLRAAGLSAAKLATLRRVGEALASGTLTEAMLDERTSPEAAALLASIKGIGPWTAANVLLRGLGRLDVFPANDSSVARNLALLPGSPPVDITRTLDALGAQRGMLYYHLLLARLEARGDVGRASASARGDAAGPAI
jgi:DNA-3-methyladenine glycosylase II